MDILFFLSISDEKGQYELECVNIVTWVGWIFGLYDTTVGLILLYLFLAPFKRVLEAQEKNKKERKSQLPTIKEESKGVEIVSNNNYINMDWDYIFRKNLKLSLIAIVSTFLNAFIFTGVSYVYDDHDPRWRIVSVGLLLMAQTDLIVNLVCCLLISPLWVPNRVRRFTHPASNKESAQDTFNTLTTTENLVNLEVLTKNKSTTMEEEDEGMDGDEEYKYEEKE